MSEMALANIKSHDIFKHQSRGVVNAVFPIYKYAEAAIHSTRIFKELVNGVYLQSGCVTGSWRNCKVRQFVKTEEMRVHEIYCNITAWPQTKDNIYTVRNRSRLGLTRMEKF